MFEILFEWIECNSFFSFDFPHYFSSSGKILIVRSFSSLFFTLNCILYVLCGITITKVLLSNTQFKCGFGGEIENSLYVTWNQIFPNCVRIAAINAVCGYQNIPIFILMMMMVVWWNNILNEISNLQNQYNILYLPHWPHTQ